MSKIGKIKNYLEGFGK